MNNNNLNLSEHLLLPMELAEESFLSLKKIGLLFTHCEESGKIEIGSRDVRIAGVRPQGLPENHISFGPFPIPINYYKHIRQNIKNHSMIKVILAFKKFQYELSGDTNQEFSIETKSELESDPSFLRMYDLIDFFEYKTPFFTELFAWIYPSNKMTKLFGVKKSKYNHLCWSQYERMKSNLVFKFNETTFTTPKILDEWIKYLPAESYKIALKMFRQAASNTTLIYETDEECLKVIEGEISDKIENADRELILNELCSVNNIPYPHTSDDYLDLFLRIKILVRKDGILSLNFDIKHPNDILKNIPKDWEKRVSRYLITGNTVYSHLDVNEI